MTRKRTQQKFEIRNYAVAHMHKLIESQEDKTDELRDLLMMRTERVVRIVGS